MIGLLRAIPITAYLIAALLLLCGTQQLRIQMLQTNAAEHARDDAIAATLAQAEARKTEYQWQKKLTEAQTDAQEKQAAAIADAASADAALDGLQAELRKLRGRIATQEATTNVGSTARGSVIELLSDMLSESVSRGNYYAAALDRSRIAGLTCERSYDSTE